MAATAQAVGEAMGVAGAALAGAAVAALAAALAAAEVGFDWSAAMLREWPASGQSRLSICSKAYVQVCKIVEQQGCGGSGGGFGSSFGGSGGVLAVIGLQSCARSMQVDGVHSRSSAAACVQKLERVARRFADRAALHVTTGVSCA